MIVYVVEINSRINKENFRDTPKVFRNIKGASNLLESVYEAAKKEFSFMEENRLRVEKSKGYLYIGDDNDYFCEVIINRVKVK